MSFSAIIALAVAGLSLASAAAAATKSNGKVGTTALDEYVWAHDENYNWVDMGEEYRFTGSLGKRGYSAYTLNMTSQRWLTDADFSADSQAGSIWWHWLVVLVPDEVKYKSNASIWITGGSMSSGAPSADDEDIALAGALAVNTGTVTGVLFQIPNEHVTFSSDPIQKSRSEDAIIAFTWQHFLDDPSQPEWLVRFPMVKASLRAMDAITDFVATSLPQLEAQLDYYIVSGASKRGWTTWLVGAVDPTRAVVIVPVVLDAINFVAVEHHEFQSYDGWSYALQDYVDLNLTMRFDDPNMPLLQAQEDPFFYRERLTMPKLVVNAGMDEFQQPDDTHYWWNDMPEPKHFLIVPNAEHSLATGILEAVPAISAFAQAQLAKDTVPEFFWDISEETGEISVTLDDTGVVHEASVWWAYSCGVNAFDDGKFRRDYRIAHMDSPCSCGPFVQGYCVNLKSFWQQQVLQESVNADGKRTYSAKLEDPGDGRWVAYFIDVRYENPHASEQMSEQESAQLYKDMRASQLQKAKAAAAAGCRKAALKVELLEDFEQFGGFPKNLGLFLEFTTEVSLWPNALPFADCNGETCGTRLV